MTKLFFILMIFSFSYAQSTESEENQDFPFITNFHSIKDGVAYRSAQLDESTLREKIRENGIKTVINLRGMAPGESWYETEKKVTSEMSVVHVNIPFEASRLPHRRDLLKLLDVFETAPRPLLIHCQAGADRTSEASAIFAMEQLGYSKKEAIDAMVSVWFGHLEWLYPAIDYFLRDVYQGSKWAMESYFPCRQHYDYYDKSMYCRLN